MDKNIKKCGLSLLERERIATYRVMGKSCRQIGDLLGRHHTTISRELKRNNKPHPMMTGYISYLAHQQAKARKRNAGARKRLKSSFIRTFVQNKLLLEWTPELIAGRLSIEYPGYKISHEAIYQYIYSDFREGIKYLARKRPKRYSRHYSRKRRVSSIPARTSITDRPAVINARKTIGHWESDSIESRQSKDILNVKLERKSRFVLIDKVSSKCSDDTHQVIIRRLKSLPDKFRKSITYDNGSENYSHNKTNEILGTKSYFCTPYHSWEKGSVENINGLIRRFIPKKTDLAKVTEEELRHIEYLLNNRPKKCLNFRTPQEVLLDALK